MKQALPNSSGHSLRGGRPHCCCQQIELCQKLSLWWPSQWASEAECYAACYPGSPLIPANILLRMQLHLLNCEFKACRRHFSLGFFKCFDHGWSFSWYSFVTTSLLLFLKVFKTEGKPMEVLMPHRQMEDLMEESKNIFWMFLQR